MFLSPFSSQHTSTSTLASSGPTSRNACCTRCLAASALSLKAAALEGAPRRDRSEGASADQFAVTRCEDARTSNRRVAARLPRIGDRHLAFGDNNPNYAPIKEFLSHSKPNRSGGDKFILGTCAIESRSVCGSHFAPCGDHQSTNMSNAPPRASLAKSARPTTRYAYPRVPGHWFYDLNRHLGLLSAFKRELASYRAMQLNCSGSAGAQPRP
jgi:hypothetical protein